jgi:hypothetical protein
MLEVSQTSGPEHVRYDERHWPFVVITLPARPMTDEQFHQHLRDVEAYPERGGPYGFVVDSRVAPSPNAVQRRVIADTMDKISRRDGARFIGIAVVLNSSAQRAVFKALLWLRQSDRPMTAVATVDEGLQWLRAIEERTAAFR